MTEATAERLAQALRTTIAICGGSPREDVFALIAVLSALAARSRMPLGLLTECITTGYKAAAKHYPPPARAD